MPTNEHRVEELVNGMQQLKWNMIQLQKTMDDLNAKMMRFQAVIDYVERDMNRYRTPPRRTQSLLSPITGTPISMVSNIRPPPFYYMDMTPSDRAEEEWMKNILFGYAKAQCFATLWWLCACIAHKFWDGLILTENSCHLSCFMLLSIEMHFDFYNWHLPCFMLLSIEMHFDFYIVVVIVILLASCCCQCTHLHGIFHAMHSFISVWRIPPAKQVWQQSKLEKH